MKRLAPPSFLDRFLLFLLPPHDRDAVSGDLYEEFIEVKVSELGRFRAYLWYMRQVLSFVPRRALASSCKGLRCGSSVPVRLWRAVGSA